MPGVRTRELAEFLQARRARLQPDDVDLPSGGRRRVPGLRREEVAQLAHVGTTWYTWLEQGRDVRPSAEVLSSIAAALQLDPDAARHLLALGGHPTASAPRACTGVAPRIQAVLDALAPYPALAVNPRFDILGYNAPYRFMITDLEDFDTKNGALLFFTEPIWRRAHLDDDAAERAIVGKLRRYFGDDLDNPAWQPLLAELEARSSRFRELWREGVVAPDSSHAKTIRSAHVGVCHYDTVPLLAQENAHVRLTVYVPGDAATARKLDRLSELIAGGLGSRRAS